jgi:hypothetical protein
MTDIKVPAPTKRTAGKGTPPTSSKAPGVVGNNITKPEIADGVVTFNKRLKRSLVEEVKQFCLDHRTDATRVTEAALREYMDKRGAGKASR